MKIQKGLITVISLLLIFPALIGTAQSVGSSDFGIIVLSTGPEYVSGGDVLVQIDVPPIVPLHKVIVELNGEDVTDAFQDVPENHSLLGLVEGLVLGNNTLVAKAKLFQHSWPFAQQTLTNYPITGTILSGPHLQPFICQTEDFELPDGTFLGTSDENCSAPTVVQYVYRSTAGEDLIPLPSTDSLPGDFATTTTTEGKTVPFVVRVETGTMDRGIYQNVILHDPTTDGEPSPLNPPNGWNKRLVAVHGSGCPGGWYIQGAALGVNLLTGDQLTRLGEGYAIFTNSLNHPSNSCNALLAGEAAMMGKEHFIETFGVPYYTVSTGGSGGAYTSLQIADAFPGLIDGVLISSTFPDALSIALSGLDSHLLSNYYLNGNPGNFTEDQIVAVSGHKNARAWYDLAMQSGRTDPVPDRVDPLPEGLFGAYNSAVWKEVVPANLRYHPTENPTGARPTIFDTARNAYGVDENGFALRPFDNVGVQYGLRQLNDGIITVQQFLDLNEKIGGYDHDSNFTAARSSADLGAVRRTYQSGLTLGASGGLGSIPIFDTSGLYDEDFIYHYQWFHFAVRERLKEAFGDASNHVMWRGGLSIWAWLGFPQPYEFPVAAAVATQSWATFIEWMEAYTADSSSTTQWEKVVSNKPAMATDGCFTKSLEPQFIEEPQTVSSEPDTDCNELWPSWSAPRLEAGGPLSGNVLKCELESLDRKAYAVSFSDEEWALLQAIFPNGVCEWSLPGVNQTDVVTYPSFGPSQENLVFDVTAPCDECDDDDDDDDSDDDDDDDDSDDD